MKKSLFICALYSTFVGSVQAQSNFQVQGDFDAEWVDCVPWDSGNNSKTYGTQPQGWVVSNVPNSLVSSVGAKGNEGDNSYVVLTNQSAAGQKIPAYMSLGTTWATAETKNTTTRNEDGGVFGGKSFTYHPDAVSMKYKRSIPKTAERASLIAYLWNGSWTQADVPGNTAVGVLIWWGSATKTVMINRDRNILGKETAQGGVVTSTSDAKLIASVESYITGTTDEWTECIAELDYGTYKNKDVNVENLNIIISSNDYFADRSTIVADNSLSVDDVTLLYYHALNSLSVSGATLAFNTETLNYDLAAQGIVFDATQLSYEKKGQGATVKTSYDASSAVLTIRVEAENISEDATAYTEYKVQYAKVTTVSELGYDANISGLYNATLNRGFKAGWNTVCLPFDVQPEDICEGAVAQAFDSSDANGLNFVKVDAMAANTPYLLYCPIAVDAGKEFKAVTLSAGAPQSITHGDFTFTGTYAAVTDMAGKYGVATIDGVDKITKGAAGSTVKGTRAYFTTSGADVQSVNLFFDGEATGIAGVEAAEGKTFDVYTLSGVQVRRGAQTLEGLAKGIYIVNGKKQVVK